MNLISCDWGTSNFRLYLVDRSNLRVISSLSSHDGVKSVNLSWQKQSTMNRTDFFWQFLQKQIKILAEQGEGTLAGLPVIISGMASSSIGMLELPYAQLPFAIGGEDLVYHKFSARSEEGHDLYLVSGLASSSDVMRGEETQIIGLQNTIRQKKALVILPGTHSKHIHIAEGKVLSFSTFMTGELFATTSNTTILAHSVQACDLKDSPLFEAFKQGVESVDKHGYLAALFKVRTRTLLDATSDEQNFAFLSGIHLGEELRQLRKLDSGTELILCAEPKMALLYRLALQSLDIQLNSYVVPGELSKLVTVYGHLAMAQHLNID